MFIFQKIVFDQMINPTPNMDSEKKKLSKDEDKPKAQFVSIDKHREVQTIEKAGKEYRKQGHTDTEVNDFKKKAYNRFDKEGWDGLRAILQEYKLTETLKWLNEQEQEKARENKPKGGGKSSGQKDSDKLKTDAQNAFAGKAEEIGADYAVNQHESHKRGEESNKRDMENDSKKGKGNSGFFT